MNSHTAGADGARQHLCTYTNDNGPVASITAGDAGLLNTPAVTMSLAGTARTVLASDAITAFASFLFRPKGKRITPSLRYIAALVAIIADLVTAAEHDPMWPCYRPLAVASFKGRDVGYRAFINVLDDLVAAGMVLVHRGDRVSRQAGNGVADYANRLIRRAHESLWDQSC